MPNNFFITGTDTGVGKTTFALNLIGSLQAEGKSVAAFKPVACGGEKNEDALLYQQKLNLPNGCSALG